jgi:hypothetical protein
MSRFGTKVKNTKRIKDVLESVAFVLAVEIFHLASGWSWRNAFVLLVGVGAGYGVGQAYDQLVEGDHAFSTYVKLQYEDACAEWFNLLCDLYHSETFLFEQDSAFLEPKYPTDRAAKWINPDNPYNLEFRQRVALIRQMIEHVDERVTNGRDAQILIQPVHG